MACCAALSAEEVVALSSCRTFTANSKELQRDFNPGQDCSGGASWNFSYSDTSYGPQKRSKKQGCCQTGPLWKVYRIPSCLGEVAEPGIIEENESIMPDIKEGLEVEALASRCLYSVRGDEKGSVSCNEVEGIDAGPNGFPEKGGAGRGLCGFRGETGVGTLLSSSLGDAMDGTLNPCESRCATAGANGSDVNPVEALFALKDSIPKKSCCCVFAATAAAAGTGGT